MNDARTSNDKSNDERTKLWASISLGLIAGAVTLLTWHNLRKRREVRDVNSTDEGNEGGVKLLRARIASLENQITSDHNKLHNDIVGLESRLALAPETSQRWQWTALGLAVISVVTGAYAVTKPPHDWWWSIAIIVGLLLGWSMIVYYPSQQIGQRIGQWIQRIRRH